jgi:SAM-dependent methyltransferase
MKDQDEYSWPEYTTEYKKQLEEIKENDKQDFFITDFDSDAKGLIFKESDNLHPNWKQLYSTAFKLGASSIFECGCGAGYHLKNLDKISFGYAFISGCDLLQSQLDYAKEFSDLPEEIYSTLQAIDLTKEIAIERQYEFVFSHAVAMHLSTQNAYKFLINMRRISSKYVFLVEGIRNHEDWFEMVKKIFNGWDFELTSEYIDYGILLTKRD